MQNITYNFENLKQKLHKNYTEGKTTEEVAIVEERFTHTLGVVETAEKLARMYGADVEKARVAALLHDCTKFYKYNDFVNKYGIKIDEEILQYPKIIHSFIGAYIAKLEYGINDEDILNAIKYHTVAKPEMTLLEEVIYIADQIEPNRGDYINEIRNIIDSAISLHENNQILKVGKKSLDIALIEILRAKIRRVKERDEHVYFLTEKAYEWYIKKAL